MAHSSLSPFRYPGSKAKLLNHILPAIQNLEGIKLSFSDIFVGGGSVALEIARLYPNSKIYLNDKDPRISAFWKVVSTDKVHDLLEMMKIIPACDLFYSCQEEMGKTDLDLAFQGIYLNRTSFSGMLSAGPIGGKGQKSKYKIGCRYNLKVLSDKILTCNGLLEGRTRVTSEDFRFAFYGQGPFYVDPPYVTKGNELYSIGMSFEDHRSLEYILKCRDNWVLSYDDCDLVRELYPPEWITEIPVKYCVKNEWREKRELLINRPTTIYS